MAAYDYRELPLFPREFFGFAEVEHYYIGDGDEEELSSEVATTEAMKQGAVWTRVRSRASSSVRSWSECGDFPT